MSTEQCRLYVGGATFIFDSVEEAREEAKKWMEFNCELRIEYLFDVEDGQADFWAYNYARSVWEPS